MFVWHTGARWQVYSNVISAETLTNSTFNTNLNLEKHPHYQWFSSSVCVCVCERISSLCCTTLCSCVSAGLIAETNVLDAYFFYWIQQSLCTLNRKTHLFPSTAYFSPQLNISHTLLEVSWWHSTDFWAHSSSSKVLLFSAVMYKQPLPSALVCVRAGGRYGVYVALSSLFFPLLFCSSLFSFLLCESDLLFSFSCPLYRLLKCHSCLVCFYVFLTFLFPLSCERSDKIALVKKKEEKTWSKCCIIDD